MVIQLWIKSASIPAASPSRRLLFRHFAKSSLLELLNIWNRRRIFDCFINEALKSKFSCIKISAMKAEVFIGVIDGD